MLQLFQLLQLQETQVVAHLFQLLQLQETQVVLQLFQLLQPTSHMKVMAFWRLPRPLQQAPGQPRSVHQGVLQAPLPAAGPQRIQRSSNSSKLLGRRTL